jgi:RNase P/RNase MRP subunit POP5
MAIACSQNKIAGDQKKMVKPKPVLSSLREKKRYLAFEIISDQNIADPRPVIEALNRAVLEMMGIVEAGKAGILVLSEKYNPTTKKGLIKVNNAYIEKARASLVLVRRIDEKEVIMQSLGASGMIHKAEEYIS